MKKLLLFSLCAGAFLPAIAQISQPRIIDTFRCDNLSANGEWMFGRSNTFELEGSYYPESSFCNVRTGEIFGTADLFLPTPYSRSIANNGVTVMSTADDFTNYLECLYVLAPGKEPIFLEEFLFTGPYAGKECYAVTITPDASKFVAYYEEGHNQYPFICSLSPDLMAGTPEYFPLPAKDVFGDAPITVALTCISDDAKVVAGMLTTGNGKYSYPIIYNLGADGKWTWNCPTLKLYDESNISSFPNFYPYQVALSADGKKFACTQTTETDANGYDEYAVWTIDLSTGEMNKIQSTNTDIVATQILNDGTIIGTFFATIKISYIYVPGAEDFVDFMEYALREKPAYGKWMEDNLVIPVQDVDQNGNIVDLLLPNTGQIFVSDDLSVFAAGIQTSEFDENYNLKMWSYAFSDFMAGIDSPRVDYMEDGVLKVYNLQGVKVLTTSDASALKGLSKGVYIVNGKKVIL